MYSLLWLTYCTDLKTANNYTIELMMKNQNAAGHKAILDTSKLEYIPIIT